MIKEIFEIEPVQKNTLIIFIAIFSLSFLQLYLFKHSIFNENSFVIVGICIALSVCYSIINMPSLYFYYCYLSEGENKNIVNINLNHIVFTFGLIAVGWIIFITYVSYELNFSFKYLIRFSILFSIMKTVLWPILGSRRILKSKAKNK